MAEAERWRSVAAASAAVERREAKLPLPIPPPLAGEVWVGAVPRRKARRYLHSVCRCSTSCFSFFRTFVARIERQRNPGTTNKLELPIPDFTSFNPGYMRRYLRRTDRDASGPPLPDLI